MSRKSKRVTAADQTSVPSSSTPLAPPITIDLPEEGIPPLTNTITSIPDQTPQLQQNETIPSINDNEKKDKEQPDDNDCIICLETIQTRGEIDSCVHQFCFSCILKWSKVTNSCPVCKRNFLEIKEIQKNLNPLKPKKKKPKVMKIKPKSQRVEPLPPPVDLFSYDIRALFLHLTHLMWPSENDSDYVDGEEFEEEDDSFWDPFPFQRSSPGVNLNDIYENGRHVIEILDDEMEPEAAWEDDEVEVLSTRPSRSRRGPRGDSLFARVGTSSYRAAPSSSSSTRSTSSASTLRTTPSSRARPSSETNRITNPRRSIGLFFSS